LLVAQENFDRSSAKLAASAFAVSAHRRPRRTSSRVAAGPSGASRDGDSADIRQAADR
jgi:hypothetical protein